MNITQELANHWEKKLSDALFVRHGSADGYTHWYYSDTERIEVNFDDRHAALYTEGVTEPLQTLNFSNVYEIEQFFTHRLLK
jgi:hypothetical protein